MMRGLICGSVLALSLGLTAAAQDAALRNGMVVKDSAGMTIGTIMRMGKGADGAPTVSLNVDGRVVTLAASTLTVSPTGRQAVSSMTKAQVKAAAGSPG